MAYHRCLRLEDSGGCQRFDRNPAASKEVAGRLGVITPPGRLLVDSLCFLRIEVNGLCGGGNVEIPGWKVVTGGKSTVAPSLPRLAKGGRTWATRPVSKLQYFATSPYVRLSKWFVSFQGHWSHTCSCGAVRRLLPSSKAKRTIELSWVIALEENGSPFFNAGLLSPRQRAEESMKKPIVILLVLVFLSVFPAVANVVDSVNASATPGVGPNYAFLVADVGWLYTAPLSYTLVGVDFHFTASDTGTVTEEIFDTTTPTLGGTLLRSATFSPAGDGFAGGTFAPLSIVAGHTYFVGTLGVLGFDGMTAAEAGAIQLPEYFDLGSGNFESPCAGCPSSTKAMLEFIGPSTPAVPEPSSLFLLGAGFAGFVGVIRRKLLR